MTALSKKVLEIEDSLQQGADRAWVEISNDGWNELVRLAAAVELVDAEEAACKRALIDALEAVKATDDHADPEVRRMVREALAGVKHE
jgi:hypothetical protein